MIPIVSILNLVSALIFWGIVLKLYFSYKRSGGPTLFYFLMTFVFFAAVVTFLATPGLVFDNLAAIGAALNITPLFGFLSLAYLVSVPLDLMGYKKIKKIIFSALVFMGFLFVLFSFLNLKESVTFFQQDPFVYWEDSRGILINILLGIFYGLSIFVTIIFFLIHGFRSSESFVRIRSMLIAVGLLCVFLAVTVNYIFGASAQSYITSIVATLINIFAAVLILAGVYYKRKAPEISYPRFDKDYPKIQW